MAKKIAWTDQAMADVRAIDRSTAMRILHGLAGAPDRSGHQGMLSDDLNSSPNAHVNKVPVIEGR
jgi:hypothetical protein